MKRFRHGGSEDGNVIFKKVPAQRPGDGNVILKKVPAHRPGGVLIKRIFFAVLCRDLFKNM